MRRSGNRRTSASTGVHGTEGYPPVAEPAPLYATGPNRRHGHPGSEPPPCVAPWGRCGRCRRWCGAGCGPPLCPRAVAP